MKRGVLLVCVGLTLSVGPSPTHGAPLTRAEMSTDTWGPIERLSSNSLQQAAVMTPDGTAMVIRAGQQITSRQALAGQPWQPAEPVPDSAGLLYLIGAGTDRSGTVTAVWRREHRSGSQSSLYAARHRSGETWSAPTLLARMPDGENLWTTPAAAFARSGAAVVAWGGFRHIRAVYLTNDGTWTEPETIASGRAPLTADVTISPGGRASVAYQFNRDLHVAQRRPRGWSDPVKLPIRATYSTGWDLDAGRPREVVLVWKTDRGPVRSGRLRDGSWTRQRLTGPIGRAKEVLVDAAQDGSARFVWALGRPWRFGDVEGTFEDDTGDAGDPIVIARRGAGCALSVLTSSPSGPGLFAGISSPTINPGEVGEAFATTWDETLSTWAPVDDLSEGTVADACGSLTAAVADDGSAVVAWSDMRPNGRDEGTVARRLLPAG